MVLDKKLINFKDPLEGEKSKGSTSGKVKIMPGTTQVVRERKMLSSNNKPVKTQAPKSQQQEGFGLDLQLLTISKVMMA